MQYVELLLFGMNAISVTTRSLLVLLVLRRYHLGMSPSKNYQVNWMADLQKWYHPVVSWNHLLWHIMVHRLITIRLYQDSHRLHQIAVRWQSVTAHHKLPLVKCSRPWSMPFHHFVSSVPTIESSLWQDRVNKGKQVTSLQWVTESNSLLNLRHDQVLTPKWFLRRNRFLLRIRKANIAVVM